MYAIRTTAAIRTSTAFWLACVLLTCNFTFAQDATKEPSSNYNWATPTLGGIQFWTDVRIEGGWRIQHNTYFGHYRLLDDSNTRQAWGEQEACVAELESQIKTGTVKRYSGKVVFLLHGLCRSSKCMQPMAEHLEEQGYQPILFRYASSRNGVADHAGHLQLVIAQLPPEVTEINFVAHSLGNIVIRHYVADCNKSRTLELDTRINRMVMLGPPNQGSRMARLLKHSAAFKLIAGASGAELSLGWDQLSKNLATPEFEFGIIAGGYGSEEAPMSNILLPGQDDFTVSEQETMLVGADDFLVKPLLHTSMMHQPTVLESTTRFLQQGFFVAKDKMRPIDSLTPDETAKAKE